MSPIDAFLPLGLTAETLLVLLVAAATFVSIMATWSTLTAGSPVGARIEAVARRREELRGLSRQPTSRRERRQRGTMSRIVSQLKLARVSQTEKLRLKLLRAGLRDREGMVVYLLCKPVLPLLFGAAGAALIYGMDFGGLPAQLKPAACAAAALLGFYGPDLYLDNLAKKRQHAIAKALLEREILDGEQIDAILRGEQLAPVTDTPAPKPPDTTPVITPAPAATRPVGPLGDVAPGASPA